MKDLHIHTVYSDGEYDEYRILKEIIKAGIDEFAICDHDTIEGSKKVYEIIKEKNLDLVFHTGVELACRLNGYKSGINMHILVRDFDFEDEALLGLLEEASMMRLKKIQRMANLIKREYGVEISKQQIYEKLKTTNSFGKPHMYAILSTMGDFDREEYYAKMRKLDSEDLKLDTLKVINTLKGHNVILAHPIEIMTEYHLSFVEIEGLIRYLAYCGLSGLEVHHSAQTINEQQKFAQMAKNLGLHASCGSDFHGPHVQPDVKLGQMFKNGNKQDRIY